MITMKNEDNPVELFIDKGLNPARIVGHSKTDHRQANPGNVVVFNANVMSKSFGKFWHGDIDLTKSAADIESISDEIREEILVLSEHSARFNNEPPEHPYETYAKVAVWSSDRGFIKHDEDAHDLLH